MEDQIRWREQILEHKETNTKWALVRYIVKFVNRTPTNILKNLSFRYNEYNEIPKRIRIEIISQSIIYFLRYNAMVENDVDFYNTIHQMITTEMKEELEYQMCLELSYWFAEALLDHRVPWPSNPENAFQHTSYSVDEDVLNDFRNQLPDISQYVVLSSMDFESKELFCKLLSETTDTYFFTQFFTSVNYRNLKHVDEAVLDLILTKSYNRSLETFMRYGGDHRMYLLACDIPIEKTFGWFAEYEINFDKYIDIYRLISFNPRLTMDRIQMLMANPRIQKDILFRRLCQETHPIVAEMVRSNLRFDSQNRLLLSRNPHITIEDVISRPDIPWDWETLSSNPSIGKPDVIEAHPEFPWVWDQWGIANSQAINETFIETHFTQLIGNQLGGPLLQDGSGIFWDGRLSNNPIVTEAIVDNHPEVVWNYHHNGLSENPNMTIPFFIEHIDKPWWLYEIVKHLSPNTEIAANAIKSWWQLQFRKRQCRRISTDLMEWWWSPDCKPAMKIRRYVFENQFEGNFQCVS
jgi:hypothetical protein